LKIVKCESDNVRLKFGEIRGTLFE
jgi:hypothetical protein